MQTVSGKVLIFSAPSGSGKSTIIGRLLERFPQLEFSISATSRAPRGTEADGREYYFLSNDDFKARAAAGEFVEWEEVYAGTCYGTLRSELKRIWDKGHVIVFDVDVKGGVNLKRIFGAQALSVFVMPPSVDELQRRLEGRGTDSPETIARRVAKAEQELAFAPQFDRVVVNDCLATAVAEAERITEAFIGNGPFHAGGNDTLFRVVQPGAPGARGRGRCRIGIDGSRSALFVVSRQNPFKAGKELAPETDRIEMARIALQSAVHSDRMAVSDIEFRLPKPNRTIRTLEKLRTEYPGRKFSLLIGSDNMAGFPKWVHSQEILDRYRVLVYPRPGYPTPESAGRTALRS